MKPLYQNIKIKACGGTNISESKDLFSYMASDFKNWKLDNDSPLSKETELAVLELNKNKTFEQMFVKPEEMYLTQAQIVEYVKENKDKIKDWYNFFLLKENGEFFIAHVRFDDRGPLSVYVRRFSDDFVWSGEGRHRVVVPQHSLKYFNSCPSETLTLESALKLVKEAGYKVYKEV